MGRIFLSYSSEDREVAQRIAQLLEAAGFEVWWDRRIPAGRTWRSVLEDQLKAMDCMVVLWSGNSIESHWVKEEAEEGRQCGVCVPVIIDEVLPPVGFRGIQSVDLRNWDGSTTALAARQLVADLESFLGKPGPKAATVQPHRAPSIKGRLTSAVRGTLATAGGAVITAIDLLRPSRYWGKRSVESAESEPPLSDTPPSEAVLFGVAAPREAAPGSSFTARFAVYIAAAKTEAQQHLEKLGEKDDRVVLDIPPDRAPRWRIGAPITIRLTCEHLTFAPAERGFEWNGRENLATFAVHVNADAPRGSVQLCFHVFLGQIPIAFIPLGIAISARPSDSPTPRVEVRAPSSAFASYSSKDADAVTHSLSTLARWAPTLDIFQDALDLSSNEAFKPQIAKEIAAREVFLLFWSRNASMSEWVLWEFETAKSKPGLNGILPMPLEDPAIAPPPPGFEDKHLRDRFMIAGYGLKKIAEIVREES